MKTWHRLAIRLCRAEERTWVEALWSELLEIESLRARLEWAAGATSIVTLSVRKRTLALLNPLTAAMALAMIATLLTGALWHAGYEGVEGVEDFFLMFAFVSGSIFLALFAFAMTRVWPGDWKSRAG